MDRRTDDDVARHLAVMAVAHVTIVYRGRPLDAVLIVLFPVQTALNRRVLTVRLVIVHQYVVRIVFAHVASVTDRRNVDLQRQQKQIC